MHKKRETTIRQIVRQISYGHGEISPRNHLVLYSGPGSTKTHISGKTHKFCWRWQTQKISIIGVIRFDIVRTAFQICFIRNLIKSFACFRNYEIQSNILGWCGVMAKTSTSLQSDVSRRVYFLTKTAHEATGTGLLPDLVFRQSVASQRVPEELVSNFRGENHPGYL